MKFSDLYFKNFRFGKNLFLPVIFLVAVFGVFSFFPAESARAEASPEKIKAALSDLSEIYGDEITTASKAKDICNLEKFMTDCAEIGKKYELYDSDERKQVDIVLSEIKGKMIDDLKNCADKTCLLSVANQLAEKLNKSAPETAKVLDLTPKKVEEKKIIVETARNAGVDIENCRTMDPDTASVELLRACAKIAKNEIVQKYLPEEAKRAAELNDSALNLKESLNKKEFECGDGTMDGCGNFCLNPTAETRTQGTSGIPPVCMTIAKKFFGPDGIKELEKAYMQVRQASDFYNKRAENMLFTTTDGKILTDPASIGKYLEEEGKKGNIETVDKGIDFMITKGFAKPEDKKFVIDMVRKVKERGKEINFDECEKNPEICEDFIPEEKREEFKVMERIHDIMSEEAEKLNIPDLNQCDSNPKYGELCLAAAKSALPKIEEAVKNSPEAQFVIKDLRRKISFGEKGLDARKRIEEKFRVKSDGFSIGNKKFNNFEQIDAFCRENGELCLAETAKQGMIDKEFASDKYEYSFEVKFDPKNQPYQPRENLPYEKTFPKYIPPGINMYNPPTEFNKEEALKQFKNWLNDPAKTSSSAPYFIIPEYNVYPENQINSKNIICPSLPTVESCSAGETKVISFSSKECGIYYKCEPLKTVIPPQNEFQNNISESGICSNELIGLLGSGCHEMAEGYFNNAMDKYVKRGGNTAIDCRTNYISGCTAGNTTYPPTNTNTYNNSICDPSLISLLGEGCHQMYTDSSGNQIFCDGPMSKSAKKGDTAATNTCDSSLSSVIINNSTVTTPCPSGQYWNGSSCVNTQTSTQTTNSSACNTGLISLLGEGCHQMFADSSGNQIFCDGHMSKSAKRGDVATTAGCSSPAGGTNTCPSGQYWNGSACANSTSVTNNCPSGQYWNGTACVNSTSSNSPEDTREKCYDGSDNDLDTFVDRADPGCANFYSTTNTTTNTTNSSSLCPSFAHDMGGYCMSNNDGSKCADYPDASSETNYSNTVCQRYTGSSSTGASSCTTSQYWTGTYCAPLNTSSSCPSGQFWYNGACTSSTSATNCASGQYWNGSACVYTNCASGQYWNGSACVSSDSSTSGSGTTCGTGQYWNGTSCVNSDTSVSSCPSGQYVNGACAYPETWGAGSGTSCSAGQYWNGSACVQTSTTDCASGQYWNGSACVSSNSSTPGSSNTSTSCPSGQYWNGNTCASSETPTSVNPSSSCPSGQYWDGSICVNSTSPTSFLRNNCPKNHKWNGDYCVVRAEYASHLFAKIKTITRNTANILFGFFK